MKIYIKDIGLYVDKEVMIEGWVRTKRSSGKIQFILVRDGTGEVQAVAFKPELGEEKFAICDKLCIESSLRVWGKVKKDERASTGYELGITDIQILQIAEDYPLQKKEHGTQFLLDNRHLWLRSAGQFPILRIRNEIIIAIRHFFYENDFILIDTPILTGSIGETATTLFATDYFDEGKAYLAQTGQLYLEAACMAFSKVYCFGPTFRAEKSKTRRHLTEFWMVEAEMAFYDSNMNMQLQEDMIIYIVNQILKKCQPELKKLNRDISKLENVKSPFPRISYDEAITILQKLGSNIEWGKDFGGDDETILTKQFDRPVFVYDYPKDIKAFYMKQHPTDYRKVKCNDLLASEGYGEIIGASQREDDYNKLMNAIQKHNLNPKSYNWYLDLRKYGSVPHSGFGLGLERTVGWICGLHHVRETIPFPRMINRLNP
ncbi:MAG: asparagine--tRNA ligase [Candidatus Cloacimonadota bacterium]|nr:MAG: asparagine--tRNA ligase [Candidatus Cloacimonadota bacterium]